MSLAYRCELCSGLQKWEITRIGDVVVSWACDDHLAAVCEGLQRDREITELRVTHCLVRPEPVVASQSGLSRVCGSTGWW